MTDKEWDEISEADKEFYHKMAIAFAAAIDKKIMENADAEIDAITAMKIAEEEAVLNRIYTAEEQHDR
jgi:hypothetical protein